MPAGEFTMGSPETEPERGASEGPAHTVAIARPFAVGRFAITRGQFAAFVEATGHKAEGGAYIWAASRWRFDANACWRNPGFAQDDDHPVVCINWNDAKAYAAWLSQRAGQTYDLMSEAEWEYVARAGTSTTFWWGTTISPEMANYDGNHAFKGGGATGEWRRGTVAVGSFEPTPGAFTRCSATAGNGRRTAGTTITAAHPVTVRHGRRATARSAWCAAGRGLPCPKGCDARPGTATLRLGVTVCRAFDCAGRLRRAGCLRSFPLGAESIFLFRSLASRLVAVTLRRSGAFFVNTSQARVEQAPGQSPGLGRRKHST